MSDFPTIDFTVTLLKAYQISLVDHEMRSTGLSRFVGDMLVFPLGCSCNHPCPLTVRVNWTTLEVIWRSMELKEGLDKVDQRSIGLDLLRANATGKKGKHAETRCGGPLGKLQRIPGGCAAGAASTIMG
ncbi:hypothetical protein G7K_0013-t1 [Saitoella complicata NRRL Y-17804]|uniref:Uncharacterized protein n=1 Tax=Saitoella complicata (strain BCRC 22490 / CBS 7301 / JCM 7358 / NBRC 10748 / NRRL Y-17804) TaxID=698492 RepID=A0A0E9N7R1_SAICN|nr:hypothetical protein G7K_0013-t1 [Saitoella complicata NRRL Y-17804]